jgi:2-polyprenyl-6-methoxyphenol hydroxylase-like FAD-dependent oxidoreductase
MNNHVLIIGGGIGGMALAAAFHTVGLTASVYEQAPEITEVGAGIGLWSNALYSLEQIGAAEQIRQSCLPITKGQIANDRGQVINGFDFTHLGSEPIPAVCYIVPRPLLLAAIADRVPRQWVYTGHCCVEVKQDDKGVEARFANGHIAQGTLLVGADGLNSVVRQTIVQNDQLRYSGQTCFRGLARIAPPDLSVVREVNGAGKRCAVCPITKELVYWWTALNAPANAPLPQEERQQFLLREYKGWPWGIAESIAATASDQILQNDLYDRLPITRWSQGRMTLMGDAAHPTTPNLGQGANMAIDDAIVLARILSQRSSVTAALHEYEAARLPRTTMIVHRSWRFGSFTRWKHPLAVKAREWMLRLTPRSVLEAELRRQILETAGRLQLDQVSAEH